MLRACLRPLGAPRRPIGADYPIVKSPVSFAATRQPMVLGQMQRRQFITLLIGAAAWPLAARAQPPDRVRRVGVLMGIADDPEGQARVMVFKRALHALGWIEGRNVQFIYRWSAGDAAHARQFANELLDLRSDVILANSTPIAIAVRDTTRTTPTVFVQVSDPVTAGVVQSLARPGRNLTGFTNFEPSIASKWLELVKRVAPNVTRVAYLFNPNTAPLFYAKAVEAAAPVLSVRPFAAAVSRCGRDGTRDRAVCARIRWRAARAAGPLHRDQPSIDHRARRPAPPAGGLSVPLLRRQRWPDVLPDRDARNIPAGGRLCRSRPQGRKARRPAGPATDQIRVCHQPQDRECARARGAGQAHRHRRRGDRVRRREFITLLGGAAAWPVAARAQQSGKLPTI